MKIMDAFQPQLCLSTTLCSYVRCIVISLTSFTIWCFSSRRRRRHTNQLLFSPLLFLLWPPKLARTLSVSSHRFLVRWIVFCTAYLRSLSYFCPNFFCPFFASVGTTRDQRDTRVVDVLVLVIFLVDLTFLYASGTSALLEQRLKANIKTYVNAYACA